MGRLDVMKSLLRSAAQATSERMAASPAAERVRKGLQGLSPTRAQLSDRRLAQAIGRSADISAATVRVSARGVSVDLELHDGRRCAATLMPIAVNFAPHGAKEITFSGMPEAALANGAIMDACASIGSEIAHTLWRPVLRDQPADADPPAFLHREGAELTVDLKSVPAVRRACRQPMAANIIEALQLVDVSLTEGVLHLRIGLPAIG